MSERCPTCGSVDGVPLWKNSYSPHTDGTHHGWHKKEPGCSEGAYSTCYPCPVCSAKPEAKETLTEWNLEGEYTLEEVRAHIVAWETVAKSPTGLSIPQRKTLKALRTAKAALLREAELCEALEKLRNEAGKYGADEFGQYKQLVFGVTAQALARKP